jgi:hypothetical protein
MVSNSETSHPEVDFEQHDVSTTDATAKYQRLVDWNVDVFTELLQKVCSHRSSNGKEFECGALQSPVTVSVGDPVDEVTEAIDLPMCCSCPPITSTTAIPVVVSVQLREFIVAITNMYRDNAFHNFDHAAHVVMSTIKLIRRISEREREVKVLSDEERCSGEVTVDPLSQLALLFGALVFRTANWSRKVILLLFSTRESAWLNKTR